MSFTLHTAAGDFRAIKALVTAQYAGVAVAVNTISNEKAATLSKDKDFLKINPTGKVPALETPQGTVWQSNAITRYLARCGPAANLLGNTFQEQAEVDQWLDFSLNELEVSGTMLYYPAIGAVAVDANTGAACKEAEGFFLAALKVLDEHLLLRTFVVGNSLTVADIAIAAALFYPFKFVLDKGLRKQCGNVVRWFQFITGQDKFRAVAGDATLCKKRVAMPKSSGGGKAAKKQKAKPAKAAKPAKPEKPATPTDLLKKLPKSPMILDDWKKVYSCATKTEEGKMEVMDEFHKNFDAKGWGVWRAEYNYDTDNSLLWKTGNLVEGVCARFDELRKFMFGTIQILVKDEGKEGKQSGNIFLKGCFLCRDPENGAKYMQKVNPDAEYWTFTKLDLSKEEDKKTLADRWCKIYEHNKTQDGLFVYDASEFK